MSDASDILTVLRVERGRPAEEDLAAVAVTLLCLAAGRRERPKPRPGVRWRRWDSAPPYRAPHSWR
ncbi:acyl-CoA carboxylase subunit epsilon [Streptomyces cyaneofuscatus]|uniref:acyl-CoA carboxylase epsilon subunit n=1 Tax=Streptomyces TaxID=1883 RepID=UPI001371F928|nr:acyl-CoA carboxylase subunit epsilon [Streptomyces sp. SID2119]